MNKRKFIYKLNKILSKYQSLAIVKVSYGFGYISIKFIIYDRKEFLSIQRIFLSKTFPKMPDDYIERILDKALKELWSKYTLPREKENL